MITGTSEVDEYMVHIPRVGRKQEGYSDEYQHF
jgi:hypothetical protein